MRLRLWILPLAAFALASSLLAADDAPVPSQGASSDSANEPKQEGKPPNADAAGRKRARAGLTEKVSVSAPRPLSAASENSIRERDLALRPLTSPEDVLRVMPGLVIAQHAGGGKADQLFLRGFDADHGTDVAVSVDGIPNNLVSHAHGQGYADLHWLIPETLVGAETRKGTYFADQGDFGTAGSINFITRDRFENPSIQLEGGSFGTRRILATGSPGMGGLTSVLAAEGTLTDGPFENPQDLRRLNLFAKLGRVLADATAFSLTATGYDGRWNASGQIPERAVESGQIDRFGSIDPSEGGFSHRYSLSAAWTSSPTPLTSREVRIFGVDYYLDLFSDFTFFASDPANGDGIEQLDRRNFYGAKASQRWVKPAESLLFETTAGGNLRLDDADVSLFHQKQRERLDVMNDATVREGSAGAFAQEEVTFNRHLRCSAALRYDVFQFDVASHLPPGSGTVQSGSNREGILQPKANLIVSLGQQSEIYLNYGVGFHSNDARSTVVNQGGVPSLPRATGYEVGLRTHPPAWKERVDLALSAWRLDLENEFVYAGDEGGTEVRGPSLREGLELEARAQIASWLWADLDYTVSRARFTQTGEPVPLAPRRLASGGLTFRSRSGFQASLRARYLGSRPAVEDRSFTATGYAVLDARLGYGRGSVECFLNVENLTDAHFREAQFYNVSRLESEASPVPDMHFTPGNPRGFRAGILYRF